MSGESAEMYDIFGVEMSAKDIEVYKAWLDMDAARLHNRVMASLEQIAIKNIRKDPEPGTDYALHTALREQFIGQSVAYDRVQGVREALKAIEVETEATASNGPQIEIGS